jgi:diguanylate cyclase (GGDEF)-like protein
MMFDIDHFKNVNDTYGHQAGDEVIRQTAATLLRTIRKTDIAGRYGGEEFSVILLDTAAKDANTLAERLRKRIEQLEVRHEDMQIKFTISLGIAEMEPSVDEYEQLVACADQALYQSKEAGRNRVTLYQR